MSDPFPIYERTAEPANQPNLPPSANVVNCRRQEIDQQQARRQLDYLSYKPGANVYLRFFYPSDDPRKEDDKGRKLDRPRWKEVERYQKDGRGVYVVVNGAGGGHEDKDIKQGSAIFCEWDDRPLEEQLLHWKTVGFLEPTFTIYSGGKSAHPYWVFDQPVTVEQWRELQRLLIEVMGADPSNKNPSRVFRLAGAWHIQPGRDPVRSEIVQDAGKKYSYEQVRQELLRLHSAHLTVDDVQQQLKLGVQHQAGAYSSNGVPQSQRYEDIQVPVIESIPLYYCLSKESRTLLDSGISQGGRNSSGAKLARDLIGTANHLQTVGQRFDDQPRQLLDDYANRCTPPLPAKEVEAIWKSAQKDNPSPSCKPEGVEACIKAWYWREHVKHKQREHRSGDGFGVSHHKNGSNDKSPVAAVSLCSRIREILDRYEQESLQVNALMDLATATGRTYSEISQLTRIIRREGDAADEVIEAVNSVKSNLKTCRKRLDIPRYLEQQLAAPLMAKADAMPTAPEYLFNTVLATSASRIGTSTQVVINPEGGYTQPCIFWTANVNHSGQAKTPPQKEIVRPLEAMEADAKETYDRQLEDYEQDNSSGRAPIRLRRILNNVTTSTKIRIHQENPRGLLEYIDELVADYQRLNQYKSGKGDDLQLELSFWNGTGGNFDRSDARLFLKRTGLSKTGTYQWDTLARLMADEVNFIASGYSARFLYCSVIDAPPRYLDLLSSRSADTLESTLTWLYGELEKLPAADYLLAHDAKVLFQGWNHSLIDAEIEEVHHGLSLVYAKIEAYTARIALWLHIVNAVLRGEKPSPAIGGETMQHAIEIASFYLWQYKLIHAHNSPTRKLEGIFLKVQTQAEKVFAKTKNGVTASFLKSRINGLKSWVVEKIRTSVLKILASAGFGRIEGEGSEMVYIPTTVPENMPPDPVGRVGEELVGPPITENTYQRNIQPTIGEIGADNSLAKDEELPGAMPQPAEDPTPSHQSTNCNPEMPAITELQKVGVPTNSSPTAPNPATAQELAALILLCENWVELVDLVEQNGENLKQAAVQMTREQRQGMSKLLADHLCENPGSLKHLGWLPVNLRDRALERLSFTIQRIGGDMWDAVVEYVTGCRFVAAEHLGTRQEQWIFKLPSGKQITAGIDAIHEISCAQ